MGIQWVRMDVSAELIKVILPLKKRKFVFQDSSLALMPKMRIL